MAQDNPAFIRAVGFVLSAEGLDKLSIDPKDPGNWTGGKVGVGTLVGTKYGISAAAHPTVDIASLNSGRAQSIYYNEYWLNINGGALAPPIGMLVFDTAVQHGVVVAIKMLQRTLGLETDGIVGPVTLAAVRKVDPSAFKIDFLSRRAMYYASLDSTEFLHEGRGWFRRLFALEAATQ